VNSEVRMVTLQVQLSSLEVDLEWYLNATLTWTGHISRHDEER